MELPVRQSLVANGLPMRPDINPDVRQFFHEWLDKNGFPFNPFFWNVPSWRELRKHSNVMLVHFNALKANMPAEIRRIADFLGTVCDAATWPRVLEHCTFDYMKRNADQVAPNPAVNLRGGKKAFFNQGTDERWRNVLTCAEIQKHEDLAARRLTPDCARWLNTGEVLCRSAQIT